MDEPWKQNAKWNKPDTEGHILYDFMYIRYQNKQICRGGMYDRGYQGLGGVWDKGGLYMVQSLSCE